MNGLDSMISYLVKNSNQRIRLGERTPRQYNGYKPAGGVLRMIQILEAEGRPIGTRELARMADVPAKYVKERLQRAVDAGMVQQNYVGKWVYL